MVAQRICSSTSSYTTFSSSYHCAIDHFDLPFVYSNRRMVQPVEVLCPPANRYFEPVERSFEYQPNRWLHVYVLPMEQSLLVWVGGGQNGGGQGEMQSLSMAFDGKSYCAFRVRSAYRNERVSRVLCDATTHDPLDDSCHAMLCCAMLCYAVLRYLHRLNERTVHPPTHDNDTSGLLAAAVARGYRWCTRGRDDDGSGCVRDGLARRGTAGAKVVQAIRVHVEANLSQLQCGRGTRVRPASMCRWRLRGRGCG